MCVQCVRRPISVCKTLKKTLSIYLPTNFVLMYMIVQRLFFPTENPEANNSELIWLVAVCVAVCVTFRIWSELCTDRFRVDIYDSAETFFPTQNLEAKNSKLFWLVAVCVAVCVTFGIYSELFACRFRVDIYDSAKTFFPTENPQVNNSELMRMVAACVANVCDI